MLTLSRRDILRLKLKAKEAKVTELQHCIATLEAERETDRALMGVTNHEHGET
jgi:hypothetical protein